MENAVAAVAERQHGVFTLAQVLECGGTREAARHRLRKGRWELVVGGVYRLHGTARTWEQSLMALTLSAGPAAAASHRSAAALLGIPGFDRSGRPEVTTPRRRRHRHPVGVVHRSRVLPADHITVVDAIPTTRVARTLVDLAGGVHPRRVERAVDNCLAVGVVTLPALAATTRDLAAKGRTGISLMRDLLEARGAGYLAPESELEDRFLRLVRAAELPHPVAQLDGGDIQGWVGRVDFAYPAQKVIIELDGRRHHSAMLDADSDRQRDNRLTAAGWRVVRLTWSDVVERPHAVVSLLSLDPPMN